MWYNKIWYRNLTTNRILIIYKTLITYRYFAIYRYLPIYRIKTRKFHEKKKKTNKNWIRKQKYEY